jgi:hypothetical protein
LARATSNPTDGLTAEELALVAELLGDAADEFSAHGNNDFVLPATDENKAIFAAVLRHRGKHAPLTVEGIMAATGEVFVYDDWAMRYFAQRCEERLKEGAAPLTPAELNAIAQLLESVALWHEGTSEEVSHDLTFPATQANKALMSAVIRHRQSGAGGESGVAETASAAMSVISASKDEKDGIDLPDFWILSYLADRCRGLAGAAPARP